ncbi:HpcH/HpaI aldolase/citrate lyase family protein [Bordetella petrii]|uniref:Citrate lyase beta chain n=1 Tax=Bordetella petrii (strain ATCC BAA-461 / DSM 12804 / CCUG 43448 / CIP 107267 / Se-1111R) TaxID=340100 RepID=A9I836_BORPD|nr:CoA ester lyase [Bordetella petrii]CAP41187.1 putative Citrate lyase beta chain [Bordetella petrii]
MNRLRSLLFVPGDRPERFDKAVAAGADAVILDLEDAVLPDAKTAARQAVAEWLATPGRPAILRINGAGTPWFDDDLRAARQAGCRAVMLPKSEDPAVLAHLRQHLGAEARLFPLVETALGAHRARELALAPGVARLVFGSVDFARDTGIQDEAGWLPVRVELVLASRLAGLAPPIDGTTLHWDDTAAVQAVAAAARRLGFGGQLCIHPRQVEPVNQGFLPSREELDWARRVVQAVAGGGRGAIAVDGKLVDKPLHDLALAWLAQAGQATPAPQA